MRADRGRADAIGALRARFTHSFDQRIAFALSRNAAA